jgi:RNA polymerase sigma factor (sigma-70 family)
MDSHLEDLVTQAKAGDKKAEELLFRYLLVRFKAIAKRRIGTRADAEDVAQEACVTVLEKYKAAMYPRGFPAWAYKILRNKIGNYYKGKPDRDSQEDIDRIPDALSVPPDCDTKMMLIRCLRQIMEKNPTYARILNLAYQGYRTEEICRRLGITSNNFYVTLSRARKMLKKCPERGVI